jgi:phage repressor protein C with HTH and peptisase S24 domain
MTIFIINMETKKMRVPIIENVVCGTYASFINEDFYETTDLAEKRILRLAKKPVLIRAAGDSMLPAFRSGDLLLFDFCLDNLTNSNVIAGYYNDVGLIKVYFANAGAVSLFSYNVEYTPISITNFDNFEIIAKFVSIFKTHKELL